MRALISLAAVAVAVVCQLTIVDRIVFPGGAGPDLVLVLVAALALANGPLAGALTGFLAGLSLDVAPPGSHFTGQNALVFCLVGYACGLLADEPSADGVAEQGHTALFEIVVTAAGAVCGEALAALLGVMLSDPRVTWPAINHVLPAAAAYDAVACPFVLFAAAAALRLAGSRGEGRTAGWSLAPARRAGSAPALAGQGAGARPAAKREPRLKLGRGSLAGGGLGTANAFGASASAAAKVKFAGRRREGVLGGSLLGGSGYRGGNSMRPGLARTNMGRSLLGGSMFSRPSPALAQRAAFGRTTLLGRSVAPRFSRGKPLSQLTGGRRQSARPRSPGRGWLRRAAPRSAAVGRATPRSAALGRAAFKGAPFKGTAFKGGAFKGGAFKRGALRGGAFKGGAFKGTPLKGGAFKGRAVSGRAFRRRPLGGGSMPGAWRGGGGPARLRMRRRKTAKRWRF